MKTTSLTAVIALTVSLNMMAQTNTDYNQKNTMQNQGTQNTQNWQRATNGTWMGNDNMQYRFDDAGNLSTSMDNKTWKPMTSNMWQDRDGRWYKVTNQRLMLSSDGATWCDVSDGRWRGPDGTWYRYEEGTIFTSPNSDQMKKTNKGTDTEKPGTKNNNNQKKSGSTSESGILGQ